MQIRHILSAGTALTAITGIFVATPALAQDSADDAVVNPNEQIIVTGTRRTDRTVADSSVPIDGICSPPSRVSAVIVTRAA